MERIADFIYRHTKLIIIFVVLVNITALVSFYRFELDTDFLSAFNEGNPKAEEYSSLNEKYSTGEPVSILIEDDHSLLSKENTLAIFNLQEDIAGINGISSVQSLLPRQIAMAGQVIPVDASFIEKNHLLLSDFIENEYYLTDQFLSEDRQNAVIIAILAPGASGGEVIDSLKELGEKTTLFEVSLAGNEVIAETMWDYLLRIIFILPPIVVVSILIVFSLMLRNRKMAVLSMIPAGLGALWTFGTIFWTSEGLSLTTILSPIFIIVIVRLMDFTILATSLIILPNTVTIKESSLSKRLKKSACPFFWLP
ncbi:MAG: MMPL family transporter [Dehalococcoidales bacterium]